MARTSNSNKEKPTATKEEIVVVVPEESASQSYTHEESIYKELLSKHGNHFIIKFNSAIRRRKMTREQAIMFCKEWFQLQR